jgi:hypothetical protein
MYSFLMLMGFTFIVDLILFYLVSKLTGGLISFFLDDKRYVPFLFLFQILLILLIVWL